MAKPPLVTVLDAFRFIMVALAWVAVAVVAGVFIDLFLVMLVD